MRTVQPLTNGGMNEQTADALALAYLTESTNTAAKSALELGGALLASIEARTRVLYGLRSPEDEETSKLNSQLVHCN